jgi:hypothetical protein
MLSEHAGVPILAAGGVSACFVEFQPTVDELRSLRVRERSLQPKVQVIRDALGRSRPDIDSSVCHSFTLRAGVGNRTLAEAGVVASCPGRGHP